LHDSDDWCFPLVPGGVGQACKKLDNIPKQSLRGGVASVLERRHCGDGLH
jgi:hypothetical protein